jgi:hypothetical protein
VPCGMRGAEKSPVFRRVSRISAACREKAENSGSGLLSAQRRAEIDVHRHQHRSGA